MNNELEDYIVQDSYHPTEKEKLAIEELTNKGLVPGDWNSQKAGITEFKDHIREYMYYEQNCRCAYCRIELPIACCYGQREHIVPKTPHPKWMFEPRNLCFACEKCNNFKWDEEFDCNKTLMGNFLDKNVYMMSSNEKYLESDYYTGFIKDYEKLSDNSQYEFIGLLPKKDIQDVINNISNDVIKNSITESEAHIQIPRFKYEYNVNNVKGILESLGIKDMFNKEKANFGGIAEDIYVSLIVQKTYIDFMENGTKASAASGETFGINSAAEEKEASDYPCSLLCS